MKKLPTTLARLYQHVRSGGKRLNCIPKLWRKWLWGTNCIDLGTEACGDMNHMHVLGLLLCFMEEAYGKDESSHSDSIQQLLATTPLVHLYAQKPIADYTLRELTTQIECLQLSWGEIMSNCDWSNVERALKLLMARLGFLAHHAFNEEDNVLDDPQYITQIPGQALFIITRKCIRQFICTFFSLFRAHHIIVNARVADELSEDRQEAIISMLKQHHVEASMDFFNVIQQMVSLAPGLRLIYRTNFAGMYNDISQVVYFHNPKFARQPQLSLKEIACTTINALPLMTELFPDIQVFYDDDPVIPILTKLHDTEALTSASANQNIPDTIQEFVRPPKLQDEDSNDKTKKFAWLICCSTVFLIDIEKKIIWASPDESLLPLVSIFLTSDMLMGQTEGAAVTEAEIILRQQRKRAADMSSAHGHITLM